jgi:hypothetical protein
VHRKMPAWFGGRPRGKGPAQQAPRRAAHPVPRRSRDGKIMPRGPSTIQAAADAFLSARWFANPNTAAATRQFSALAARCR